MRIVGLRLKFFRVIYLYCATGSGPSRVSALASFWRGMSSIGLSRNSPEKGKLAGRMLAAKLTGMRVTLLYSLRKQKFSRLQATDCNLEYLDHFSSRFPSPRFVGQGIRFMEPPVEPCGTWFVRKFSGKATSEIPGNQITRCSRDELSACQRTR